MLKGLELARYNLMLNKKNTHNSHTDTVESNMEMQSPPVEWIQVPGWALWTEDFILVESEKKIIENKKNIKISANVKGKSQDQENLGFCMPLKTQI